MKISIEQYENLVVLLKKVLEFYANDNNYNGRKDIVGLIDKDGGSQARFALKKIEELVEINEKLEQDIINNIGKKINSNNDLDDDEVRSINNLIEAYKNIKNDE